MTGVHDSNHDDGYDYNDPNDNDNEDTTNHERRTITRTAHGKARRNEWEFSSSNGTGNGNWEFSRQRTWGTEKRRNGRINDTQLHFCGVCDSTRLDLDVFMVLFF